MVIVIAGVEVIVDTTTSVMVIVVGLGMAPPWSSMLEVEVTVGLLLSSGVVLGLSSTEVVGDALPEVDEPLEEDSSSSSSSLPPLPLPLSGCAARFVMTASVGDTTSPVEVGETLSSVMVVTTSSSVLVEEELVAVLVRVTPVTKPVAVGTTPVEYPVPVAKS